MGVIRVLAIVSLAATAHADSKPRVDWERGLVIGTGVGVADRHAPSPEVARGTARRGAEDAARKQIAAALATLPLAAGGTLADKLPNPRIDAALASAITLAADPETDGAWTVTLAVPIESLRQALAGPRTIESGKGGDQAPPVVILDNAKATPAVGYSAPTLFVKTVPAYAASAPHVKARGIKAGVIDADGVGRGTLVIIPTP